ncbi:MAG: tetratricopeptide repeat protein [Thermodesulfobacteriota bacterium]|nr:tetratricopeptide repeat protein [Thermodesulfobacteriota bacterium]
METSSVKNVTVLLILLILCHLCPLLGCSSVENEKRAEKLYELGLNALDEKNNDEAGAYFEKAVQIDPDHAKAHYQLGVLYISSKQMNLAEKELNLAITKDQGFNQAKRILARLYYRKHAYERAISICRELIEDSGQDHETLFILGDSLLNRGHTGEAKRVLIEAVKAFPDNSSLKIRLTIASVYLKTGKLLLALEELDRILDAEPDNHRARGLRAEIHLKSKRYEDAASDYRHLMQRNPSSQYVRFRLAEIYQAQGKLDDALELFGEILDSYPDPSKPLEKTVKIYVAKGKFKKALELCNDYLKKWPKHLRIGLLKAMLLIKQKRYETAEKFLSDLIREHPRSDDLLILKAGIHKSRREYESALREYQKAIDIDPHNIQAHMEVAAIYQKAGNFDRAADLYENIIRMNDAYGPAANDLAYLYADRNQQLDRALALALKARELMPDSPEVNDTLGWTYLKKGSTLLAKKYLHKAIEKMPHSALFHYHLGMAFYQDNNFSEAKKEFTQAMKLGLKGRDSAIAKKLLQEIKANDVL